MSSDPGRIRALSGGPLDEQPPETGPFDVPDLERYADAGQLGAGGMGEVRVVTDLRLGREVALKVTHAGDRAAEARLVREAALAASLDHPGIVAVHGAGRLPDGRAFYTMPVVRGRSLADAIEEGPDLETRLRLVRRVLGVAQAVAYAHAQGIVHRDIKPANVMLGEHGETLVVDWGLAARVGTEGTSGPARTGAGELTLTGEVFGTPGFMSPEQAAGEPAAFSADVYAIGGLLYTLLSGRAPNAGRKVDEPPVSLRERCPELPPDLAALVDRALAVDPRARYPNAFALSADLAAWVDGRRVAAHDYSPRELAARLLVRYRLPLGIALVALIGVAIAAGIGAVQTLQERDRALLAEEDAQAAQARSELNLGRAVLAQALVAADRGDAARAEVLAAHALRFEESPDARGILAAVGARLRPERLAYEALTDCASFSADPAGQRVACLDAEPTLHTLDGSLDPSPIPPSDRVALTTDGRALLVIERDVAWWSPGSPARPLNQLVEGQSVRTTTDGSVFRLHRSGMDRLVDGQVLPVPDCPNRGASLGVAVGEQVVLACASRGSSSGGVAQVDGERSNWLFRLEVDHGPASALAVQGPLVAVGTEGGRVRVHREGEGLILDQPVRFPGVRDLALSGDRLAVAGSGGGVDVLDVRTGQVVASLPSEEASVHWQGPETLRIIDGGVADWRIPAQAPSHVLGFGSGVAGLSISADGLEVASAHGDGQVHVSTLATGARVFSRLLDESVAKDVAWSPDGAVLAAGSAQGRVLHLLDPATGETLRTVPTLKTKRLGWTADRLYLVPYAYGLLEVDGAEVRAVPGIDGAVADLEVWAGGVVLVEEGRIHRIADGRQVIREGAVDNAVAGTDDAVFVADDGALHRLDAALQLERTVEVGHSRIVELAASADGRLLAVGQLDGRVTVWDAQTLELRAALRGHTRRVASLDFAGDTLVSGGWDGDVRVWDMSVLDASPAALIERAEGTWSMDMGEALGG